MKRILTYSVTLIIVLTCISFAPVFVASLIPFGKGTSPKDTAYANNSMRVDSAVRFIRYGTSDTNKVLGVGSNGILTLRNKRNADSSIFATRNYVISTYVPLARTITTGWNGTVFTLTANAVLQSPTLEQVTSKDSTSNHYCNFTKQFKVTTQDGSGYTYKVLLGGQTGAGSYNNAMALAAVYNTSDTIYKFGLGPSGFYDLMVSPDLTHKSRLQFALNDATINFAAGGTVAYTNNLLTGTITGDGIATSFTIVAPTSGTVVVASSASSGATVQSATISGTTITIKTTSAPAIGTYTIAYWYK
jgi:hypothetical protein